MSEPIGGPPNGQLHPPLRLVRLLAPSEPRKKKRRRRQGVFTAAQEAWIRTSLKNARASFGTWACLADAMGVGDNAVMDVARGRKGVSGDMAIRFAVAAGISLDALLRSGVESAGRCPSCGRTREGIQ